MPLLLRKLVNGVPRLVRVAGRLAREGCRSRCCGPPPPPRCICYPDIGYSCGCPGGPDICCPCSPNYHFTFDVTAEYDNSAVEVADRWCPPDFSQHCDQRSQEHRRTTWTIRIAASCTADGHATIDYSGSVMTRDWRYVLNGVVIIDRHDEFHGVEAIWNEVADIRPFMRCFISPDMFWNPALAAPNETGTCCARSGHYSHATRPQFLACGSDYDYIYDPAGCASGLEETNSLFTSQGGCGGGSFSQHQDYNHYASADGCQSRLCVTGQVSGVEEFQSTADISGSWTRTNDTPCQPDPCASPPPAGACCGVFPFHFGQANCIVTHADGCAGRGGVYRGDGTDCTTTTCPDIGACCQPDGGCRQTTQSRCAPQGRWLGANTRCPPPGDFTCGGGACCRTDGTCVFGARSLCAAIGGVYLGDGTACGPNSCLPTLPAGACCQTDGSCLSTTHAGCDSVGGTYLGDGTSCATSTCGTTGACCIDGGASGCFDGLTQQQCGDRVRGIGGSHSVVWRPGETCAQIGCVVGQPVRIEAAGVRSFV